MSSDNKWSQPDAPPPPLFTGKKEKDLVKQVNDELIERVIGQQVIYYPIDLETTDFHPIYGEAKVKNFLPPVRVYALVEWNKYSTTFKSGVGLDKEEEIIVHFHKRRLTEDQDLFVRDGDFVLYGAQHYEIVSTSEPKQLFGQIGNAIEISAKCIRAREGIFNAA
jgi:hypothetical protein